MEEIKIEIEILSAGTMVTGNHKYTIWSDRLSL